MTEVEVLKMYGFGLTQSRGDGLTGIYDSNDHLVLDKVASAMSDFSKQQIALLKRKLKDEIDIMSEQEPLDRRSVKSLIDSLS